MTADKRMFFYFWLLPFCYAPASAHGNLSWHDRGAMVAIQ
jgi:hypothetical protein